MEFLSTLIERKKFGIENNKKYFTTRLMKYIIRKNNRYFIIILFFKKLIKSRKRKRNRTKGRRPRRNKISTRCHEIRERIRIIRRESNLDRNRLT